MKITSAMFNALWMSNGKAMTVFSYVYLVAAAGCLFGGDTVSAMLALVLAELNRVDKEARVLTCEQASAIVYEADHPEEFDNKDDDNE